VIRLGDLVAEAYERARELARSEPAAARLAAGEVVAALERQRRHDLLTMLREGEAALAPPSPSPSSSPSSSRVPPEPPERLGGSSEEVPAPTPC
jgi:hypothetical protein